MRGPRRKIDRDSRAQPCDEERTNEIVADIIAAVGGVPESLVRRLIDDLRTETPSLTGNKRKNKRRPARCRGRRPRSSAH